MKLLSMGGLHSCLAMGGKQPSSNGFCDCSALY